MANIEQSEYHSHHSDIHAQTPKRKYSDEDFTKKNIRNKFNAYTAPSIITKFNCRWIFIPDII